MAPAPFDFELGRRVKADTLEPHQQPTSPELATATDFRRQWMLKHPYLSEFHSQPTYLHAGLLEGDPAVTSYVPRPFRLQVGQRRYTPACYVARTDGPRQIVEIRPHGELVAALLDPLTQFFARQRMQFVVLNKEDIYARRNEAENWLEIVRILRLGRDVDTQATEEAVLARFRSSVTITLGDIIDPGDRERTYPQEIALFRLLHRGLLSADLTERPLDYDTRIHACE